MMLMLFQEVCSYLGVLFQTWKRFPGTCSWLILGRKCQCVFTERAIGGSQEPGGGNKWAELGATHPAAASAALRGAEALPGLTGNSCTFYILHWMQQSEQHPAELMMWYWHEWKLLVVFRFTLCSTENSEFVVLHFFLMFKWLFCTSLSCIRGLLSII